MRDRGGGASFLRLPVLGQTTQHLRRERTERLLLRAASRPWLQRPDLMPQEGVQPLRAYYQLPFLPPLRRPPAQMGEDHRCLLFYCSFTISSGLVGGQQEDLLPAVVDQLTGIREEPRASPLLQDRAVGPRPGLVAEGSHRGVEAGYMERTHTRLISRE